MGGASVQERAFATTTTWQRSVGCQLAVAESNTPRFPTLRAHLAAWLPTPRYMYWFGSQGEIQIGPEGSLS